MTLDEARKILGDDAKELSDEELQEVIELIQVICNITIEEYLSERDGE